MIKPDTLEQRRGRAYIPTWEGWLFLATVIDCHTKAVIGWAMDDNYKTPLIATAIETGLLQGRDLSVSGDSE
jgi:transposase InsO family protein